MNYIHLGIIHYFGIKTDLDVIHPLAPPNPTKFNWGQSNINLVNQTDSGRVLGYDNAHGFHHRHYMGKIEAVAFVSFELTSKLFASEWIQIANSLNAKGTST